MLATIQMKLFTVLAQASTTGDGNCPGPNTPDKRLRDYLDCSAFQIPVFALKVLAVGFFIYAIFKAVTALAGGKISAMAGFFLAGVVAVFLGFNPGVIADLVEQIGEVFKGISNMFSGN